MRILVIEDDLHLADNLRSALEKERYSVDLCNDGEAGLFHICEYPLDMAVVDLGLPKIDGIELIRQARKNGVDIPILILTARDRWQDKVEGLDAGADDYLTKPFHVEEFIARCNALIRRSAGQANPEIENGPIRIHTRSQQVWVEERELNLTAYEYKVLEYLMLNPDRVVSKTELSDHLYDQDFDRDSNVIEVFVGRLRKKINPVDFIRTVRGQGYRFVTEG